MGNFSNDPDVDLQNAVAKGYRRVLFQQGKPLLDRELNLLGGLASPKRMLEHYVGNGVPADSDGFRISALDTANNDFTIGAGRCLVAGIEIVLAVDATYRTQPNSANVANLPPGLSNIYLRVFSSEVDGTADADLQNSADVGFETTLRQKAEWEVLVSQPAIAGADHFLLAVIDAGAQSIMDQRRTGLTVAPILDEVKLLRGSTEQMTTRMDKSLTAGGDLKPNTVGSDQLEDNSVAAAKLRSHASDNAQRAVGKQHIQDGSVSLVQLAAELVLDAETSVPAAPSGALGESTMNIQIESQHAFYLISVRYISPIPRFTDLTHRRVEWHRKSVVVRLSLPLPSVSHRHQLVLRNPHPFPITVACKAYRLAEA